MVRRRGLRVFGVTGNRGDPGSWRTTPWHSRTPRARCAHQNLQFCAHISSSRKRHDWRFWPILCYRISAEPGTELDYLAPETSFEGRTGLETDVWALGCAIFEIRAGCPLFDPFFSSYTDILVRTVGTLGRLPDPWWGSFEDRAVWFEEDGEPKSVEAQERAQADDEPEFPFEVPKSSIGEKLRSIGTQDDPPYSDEGPMMEKSGVKLDEEVKLLEDLLRKMLRYRPEERIGMQEVVEHPWFAYVSGSA